MKETFSCFRFRSIIPSLKFSLNVMKTITSFIIVVVVNNRLIDE